MRVEELLLDITFKIIRLATDLEQRKFYHEDLKCCNIIRRHADGEIVFIDLGGGLTRGMYREERESVIKYDGGPDAADTLWEEHYGSSGLPIVRGKMYPSILSRTKQFVPSLWTVNKATWKVSTV